MFYYFHFLTLKKVKFDQKLPKLIDCVREITGKGLKEEKRLKTPEKKLDFLFAQQRLKF